MAKAAKRKFKVGDRIRKLLNGALWRRGEIIYITPSSVGVKFDGSSTGERVPPDSLQFEDGTLPDSIVDLGSE